MGDTHAGGVGETSKVSREKRRSRQRAAAGATQVGKKIRSSSERGGTGSSGSTRESSRGSSGSTSNACDSSSRRSKCLLKKRQQ